MRAKSRIWKATTLILVLVAALMVAGAAAAQEEEAVELEGIVVAIDPDSSTFEIEVENDLGELETYTVKVGQNFNYDSIEIGDLLEVKGTTIEDGQLVLSEYKIEERARDREQEQEGDGENYFCTSSEDQHPVAAGMAETYGVTYEEIMTWFCGEQTVGLGQIMLALQTAEVTGETADTYLTGRQEGKGWGEIWQEADLIGKPDKEDPPGQVKKEEKTGEPEDKVPPGQEKKSDYCEEGEEGGEECDEWMPPGQEKKEWEDGEWVPPGQRGR